MLGQSECNLSKVYVQMYMRYASFLSMKVNLIDWKSLTQAKVIFPNA